MLMCSIDCGLFKSVQSVHIFLFPLNLLSLALFPLLLRFFSSPKQLTALFIYTIILTHSKKKAFHAFPLPDGLKDIKGDSQIVKWKWPINDWKATQPPIIIGEMWMGCSIPCIGFLKIKEFEKTPCWHSIREEAQTGSWPTFLKGNLVISFKV